MTKKSLTQSYVGGLNSNPADGERPRVVRIDRNSDAAKVEREDGTVSLTTTDNSMTKTLDSGKDA